MQHQTKSVLDVIGRFSPQRLLFDRSLIRHDEQLMNNLDEFYTLLVAARTKKCENPQDQEYKHSRSAARVCCQSTAFHFTSCDC